MALQRISDLTPGTPPYSNDSLLELSVPTGTSPPYASYKAQLAEITVNQTITLSGDLTGSGTTSINAQIAANAVSSAEIANAAVTYAKVQNVTAARLLGNPTGSATAPSEITLGTNLSFAGTVLNASGGASGLSGMTAGQIPIAATATTVTSSANLSGDVTSNAALLTTLATVNANVGTFQGLTLDAKGRVTAAANQAYAPLASPVFTGTPSLPTGATGVTQTAATSNTTLATTAYVKANVPVPLTVALGGTGATTQPLNAAGGFGLTHTLLRSDGTTITPMSAADGTVGMAAGFGGGSLYCVGAGREGQFGFGRANGTFASPTAVLLNQAIGAITIDGTYAGNWGAASRAAAIWTATENWTSTANGTSLSFTTTLTGTLTTATRVMIQAGLMVGIPTGLDKGVGTINATIVHANGTVLTSDADLKRDIGELPKCLPLVEAIEPHSYRWREPDDPNMVPPGWADQTRWGFLAQDVEHALRHHKVGVVDVGPDGTRGLSLGDLTAMLWQAVRELSAEVAALKAGSAK